jgi:Zn finger protein HypA/HybF involved in hydrogenase expression
MTYYQHKFKCGACGLHFIVCSDAEDWPDHNTTREQTVGEATGLVYCPECGDIHIHIHWLEPVEGFIFQAVPGDAELIGIKGYGKYK